MSRDESRTQVARPCRFAATLAFFLLGLAASASLRADDLEAEPILYSATTPHNGVSELQRRIAAGQTRLRFDPESGYLPSVLRELKIPVSSQMLVFSKTSLQRHHISPRTPRALYFGDEVYIGYCLDGEVMELAAVDPKLGAVFYTLEQREEARPLFRRQWDSCLICHGSSALQGLPGHLVRSVYPDSSGNPILTTATFRTDQASPFKQRWGGWYVTGTSGAQLHMGNLIVQNKRRAEHEDLASGSNLTSLAGIVDLRRHLSPHSDIVALMVFEHQAEMHNRITRAGMQARQAIHQEAELNRELKYGPTHKFESTTSRIRAAGEPLVKYLFFSKETRLSEPIRGTSAFAQEFAAAGPRDPSGRSLRDLDLKSRLFKHPCSYLVHSPAFDAMPEAMLDYVYGRMADILSGRDTSADYAHLTEPDRFAILEILLATKPSLPEKWRRRFEEVRRPPG